ncbi:hypothetical protein [Streptomyces sp. KL116D]|uniref:hypothetical protein n=1 Tax=Streptomyces sp. KL116D TaxID=3045152 RepID=UPI0035562737
MGRIGVAVGFGDSANFSKYFLQHTGVTPAAFRRAGLSAPLRLYVKSSGKGR